MYNVYLYVQCALYVKCIRMLLFNYTDFALLPDCPQTYSITVQHASKAEISVLKSNGVVGGKAGRCALFSARDVCRMFHHWKTMAPQALQDLAEGKVRNMCCGSTCISAGSMNQYS